MAWGAQCDSTACPLYILYAYTIYYYTIQGSDSTMYIQTKNCVYMYKSHGAFMGYTTVHDPN